MHHIHLMIWRQILDNCIRNYVISPASNLSEDVVLSCQNSLKLLEMHYDCDLSFNDFASFICEMASKQSHAPMRLFLHICEQQFYILP